MSAKCIRDNDERTWKILVSFSQIYFIYLFIIYLGSIIVQMVLHPKLKK